MRPRLVRNWWMLVWLSQLVPLAPVVGFALLRLYTGPSLGWIMLPAAAVSLAYAAFVVAWAATRRGRRWIHGHRYQMILSLAAALVAYVACEVAATTLHLAGVAGDAGDSLWVFEHSQETVHFDPLRGFRLTPTPSRVARITYGTLAYVGLLRGNNMGFPDRDDFTAKRTDGKRRRLAVFGDSFTSAPFLRLNWPDAVEDLTRDAKRPLEALNFAVDGGGLGNWWSILTRIVKADGFEIDGVVFAAYTGDVLRTFSIAEHRGCDRPRFARVPTWDPRYLPATREEGEAYLEPLSGYILTTPEFDAALRGEWTPRKRGFGLPAPYLAGSAVQFVERSCRLLGAHRVIESERKALIEDMRQCLRSMRVPVVVVSIPTREALLEHGAEVEVPADTREFAAMIGAELVNGASAFKGLSQAEIRASFFPYDGHWCQAGSDRFARFMVKVLAKGP